MADKGGFVLDKATFNKDKAMILNAEIVSWCVGPVYSVSRSLLYLFIVYSGLVLVYSTIFP